MKKMWVLLGLIGLVIYGSFIELNRLQVEKKILSIPDLPKDLVGFRILQLSDFHMIKPGFREKKVLAEVDKIKPDLIVITGDLIGYKPLSLYYKPAKVDECLSFFRSLKAKYGVFVIRGNVEATGSNPRPTVERFLQELEKSGIRILEDEAKILPAGSASIYLAGVDFFYLDNSPFLIREVKNNRVISTTSSPGNSFSHFIGDDSIHWADYEYEGRMKASLAESGFGVSFYSSLPWGRHKLYRLRRYQDRPEFYIMPCGTGPLIGCDKAEVNPGPGIWYKFRIKVATLDDRTAIKAKVWEEEGIEPSTWAIDCYDSGPERHRSGTVGVWAFAEGLKDFDDLVVRQGDKMLFQEDFETIPAGKSPENWQDDTDRTYIRGLLQNAPEDAFKIFLSHSPDLLYEAVRSKINLMLAGDTHGGQVCLPGIGPVLPKTRLGRKFAGGLHQIDETILYVNRGVGWNIIPFRFLCPPEITVLELDSRKGTKQ
ncbi:MAG: metallophosphoesterase [bacterium]|nr:metallophosphoesterase [bacterium]